MNDDRAALIRVCTGLVLVMLTAYSVWMATGSVHWGLAALCALGVWWTVNG